MHSAIFAVDMPQETERQRWFRYLGLVTPRIERAAVEKIAENVWQVDFQKSPAALAHLIAVADSTICPTGSWRCLPSRNGFRLRLWLRRATDAASRRKTANSEWRVASSE
jgi:hypothetical protein